MQSVIFDLDDTLYQSRKLRNARHNALLNFLKERAQEYIELKKTKKSIESFNAMGIKTSTFYKVLRTVPLPFSKDHQLREMLQRLKNKYKLIVLSNSETKMIKKTLTTLGIFDVFDEIYGGDCFNEPKPAKECFFMVKKGDICVGNQFDKDLSVPKEKKAITVLLSVKHNQDADFIIKNIHELEKLPIFDDIK